MVEKVPGWPGTGLSGEEMMKKVPREEYAPRLTYAWAAGEAMTRFLDELKAGRFISRKCNRCDTLLFPPRMFCEECYRPTDSWEHIRDTGTIETFSVSYLAQDSSRIKEPIFVGVVTLDGPTYQTPETGRPRMGLMHYFGEIKKDGKAPFGYDIHTGMRVKAVWKSDAERTGSILDVKYFRPLKPGEDPFEASKPAAKGKPAKSKGGKN